MTRPDRQEEAYEMRLRGLTWGAIGEALGLGHAGNACAAARAHAERADVPWPPRVRRGPRGPKPAPGRRWSVMLRATVEERAEIERQAEAAGRSVGRYLVELALDGAVPANQHEGSTKL